MYKNLICSLGSAVVPTLLFSSLMLPKAATATFYTPNSTPFKDVTRYTDQRLDYEVIGNTETTGETKYSCGSKPDSSDTLRIDPEAKVVKAVLYWSGTGYLDNHVKLNGHSVYAQKNYSAKASNVKLYGASADVTSLVQGAGSYTVSSLSWDNSLFTCLTNGAYGGWNLVVVYGDEKLPKTNIVWQEGFEYSLTLFAKPRDINISIPNVVAASCKPDGVTTVVSWEGDSYKPEKFSINGSLEGDNEFNGFSNAFGRTTFNQDVDNYLLDLKDKSSVDYSFKSFFTYTKFGLAVEGVALNAILIRTSSEDTCTGTNPDTDPDDK